MTWKVASEETGDLGKKIVKIKKDLEKAQEKITKNDFSKKKGE